MSEELVFYTNPMSRGRIARWMLEEVGAPYRTEILGYGRSMKGDAYRAVNPMGKVPALRHGDVVVTETAAILAYLADAFPAAGLAPAPDTPARGPYYRWMFFAAAPFEAAVTVERLGVKAPPERQAMLGWGSLDAVLDTLEAAVSQGPYLAGGKFSAADVYVGSQLGFTMQFGSIPKRPAFEQYVAHVYARPAAVRARAIDDALIAEATPAA